MAGRFQAAGAPPEVLALVDGPGDPEELLHGLAGYEFVGMLRQAAPVADEVPEMLEAMVGQAEEHGGPAALAMLRALAVTAPAKVRTAAAAAADRLVSTGLADPVWASVLGAVKVSTCFGYVDPFGAQESIVLTFGYGRKRHAVAVLIDHDLGGGVKDCWLSDQPTRIRSKFKAAGSAMGVDVRDYPTGRRQRRCTLAP